MRPRSKRHRCQCIVRKIYIRQLSKHFRIGSIWRPCRRLVTGQGRSQYCCLEHSKKAEEDSRIERSPGDTRRSRDVDLLREFTPDEYEIIGYYRRPVIFSPEEISAALADISALSPPMPFILQQSFTQDGEVTSQDHGMISTSGFQNLLQQFYWVRVKHVGRGRQKQFAVHLYYAINLYDLEKILCHQGRTLEQWRRSTRWVKRDIPSDTGSTHSIIIRQACADIFRLSEIFTEL